MKKLQLCAAAPLLSEKGLVLTGDAPSRARPEFCLKEEIHKFNMTAE